MKTQECRRLLCGEALYSRWIHLTGLDEKSRPRNWYFRERQCKTHMLIIAEGGGCVNGDSKSFDLVPRPAAGSGAWLLPGLWPGDL